VEKPEESMSSSCRSFVFGVAAVALALALAVAGSGLVRADEAQAQAPAKLKFADYSKDFASYQGKLIELKGKVVWQSDDGKWLEMGDCHGEAACEGAEKKAGEVVKIDATGLADAPPKMVGECVRVVGTGSRRDDKMGSYALVILTAIEKLDASTCTPEEKAACEEAGKGGCCEAKAKKAAEAGATKPPCCGGGDAKDKPANP
jgi:hypothetical protein